MSLSTTGNTAPCSLLCRSVQYKRSHGCSYVNRWCLCREAILCSSAAACAREQVQVSERRLTRAAPWGCLSTLRLSHSIWAGEQARAKNVCSQLVIAHVAFVTLLLRRFMTVLQVRSFFRPLAGGVTYGHAAPLYALARGGCSAPLRWGHLGGAVSGYAQMSSMRT